MSASKETTLSGYYVRAMPHGKGEGKTLQITDKHSLFKADETINLPMSEELVEALRDELSMSNEDMIAKIKEERGE